MKKKEFFDLLAQLGTLSAKQKALLAEVLAKEEKEIGRASCRERV